MLSFANHSLPTVYHPASQASLCQINRAKHKLTAYKNLLITVINALVFSKLCYYSSLWSNTSSIQISRSSEFCSKSREQFKETRPHYPNSKELGWFHCEIVSILSKCSIGKMYERLCTDLPIVSVQNQR